PHEPDLVSIKSISSKTRTHLGCLDSEISRIQGVLKELEDERAAVSDFHAQNTAILSPIRRMPPEVLGEIFSWTLP
ncbi:hypothetical protein FB451DRAFT_989045, partial [Mycena latifolia]